MSGITKTKVETRKDRHGNNCVITKVTGLVGWGSKAYFTINYEGSARYWTKPSGSPAFMSLKSARARVDNN